MIKILVFLALLSASVCAQSDTMWTYDTIKQIKKTAKYLPPAPAKSDRVIPRTLGGIAIAAGLSCLYFTVDNYCNPEYGVYWSRGPKGNAVQNKTLVVGISVSIAALALGVNEVLK